MAMHTGQDLVQTSQAGSVAIAGTVAVNLQAVAATTVTYSTAVIMAGVTPNHAVTMQDMGLVSGATANSVGSSARILFSVQPQVGQVTMTFVNQGAAVNAGDRVYSYVATQILPND